MKIRKLAVNGRRCSLCMRSHTGKCDPATLELVRQQRNQSSSRQAKLLKLCRDYVRAKFPHIYEQLAEQAGVTELRLREETR